jgi:hypothetical protein
VLSVHRGYRAVLPLDVRRWTVEDDLPAQPAFEKYRDAVALLHLNGAHVGYLATKVEGMRAGLLLRRGETIWLLLTRLDGSRARDAIQEDYAPWGYICELEDDHINWAGPDGDVHYQVRWLEGDERRDAWGRYGIVEEVGAYMDGSR